MKKIIRLFILPLAALFLLVSCITFEENYLLKKDGSGSFEFKVDMSQIMSMMKMMEGMQQEGEGQQDPTEEINFKSEIEKLEKLDGISNVQANEDKEGGFFSLSFDFKDFESLNNARHEALDSTGAMEDVLVKKGNKVFFHHATPGDLAAQGAGSEEDSLANAMGAGMLSQFQYKVNFTVEGGAKSVKTQASNNYGTSDKKTFRLEGTVQDLMDNPELMNTEIEF